jgi:hypothetical protein
MSRFVIAAALLVSFTASVRAAAPTFTTSITGASSGVVTCPTRDCVVAHHGVRL